MQHNGQVNSLDNAIIAVKIMERDVLTDEARP